MIAEKRLRKLYGQRIIGSERFLERKMAQYGAVMVQIEERGT